MTVSQAIEHAYRLQAKWVGVHPGVCYDLNRIHASMLQEHRWNQERPARCTPECAKETKGELILLGKVRKALAGNSVVLESDRCPTCGLFLCGHYSHLPQNAKCLCSHPRWLHNRRNTPQEYEECRSKGCKCTHYMEEQKQKPAPQSEQDAAFDSWAHYNSGHNDIG